MDGRTEEMRAGGAMTMQPVLYRCDRGHQPTSPLTVNDGLGNSVVICLRCAMELLEQHCGKVERALP